MMRKGRQPKCDGFGGKKWKEETHATPNDEGEVESDCATNVRVAKTQFKRSVSISRAPKIKGFIQ